MSLSNLFKGRINRKNYLIGQLIILICFSLWFIPLILPTSTPSMVITSFLLLALIMELLTFPFEISLTVRRFHDVGKPSSYALFLIFPLFCILWLLFKSGQKETNKFGEIPSNKIKISSVILGK